ncbi:MAG: iron-sulfur cluster assembly scaffold protein, partial [Gallionella sp.]
MGYMQARNFFRNTAVGMKPGFLEVPLSDMKQLYQEVILDHNRKPRNWGAVADANRHAEGHNPLCGDHINLSLNV